MVTTMEVDMEVDMVADMEANMVADMEEVKGADMFKTKCIKPKMSTFMSATHDNPKFPIG